MNSPQPPIDPLVLIVDDHQDNRFIYRSMLLHLGYRVVEAGDGNEAIAMARSDQPDAILMEVFTGAGSGTMIVGRKEKATYIGVDLAD